MVDVDSKWMKRIANQNTQTPPITMTNRLPPSLAIHYTHQQYLYNTQTFLSHVALLLGLHDPDDKGILNLQNVGNFSIKDSVISPKNRTFSNTAVRTQNLALVCMFRPAKI
jgi:hypothetical protein